MTYQNKILNWYSTGMIGQACSIAVPHARLHKLTAHSIPHMPSPLAIKLHTGEEDTAVLTRGTLQLTMVLEMMMVWVGGGRRSTCRMQNRPRGMVL